MEAEVLRQDNGGGSQVLGARSAAFFESGMVSRVEEYLRQYMYDSAAFLCERLVAELPSEDNIYLLAQCYQASNQPHRVYHYLKGSKHIPSRFLFATVCVALNRLPEAEEALSLGSGTRKVINGAAGLYLMGRIHVLSERHATAIAYFQAALRLDPMLWGAFEALCTLGAELEADAYIRSTAEEYPYDLAGTSSIPGGSKQAESAASGAAGRAEPTATGLTARLRTSLDFASPSMSQSDAVPLSPGFSFPSVASRSSSQQVNETPDSMRATPIIGGLSSRLSTPASTSSSSFITPSPAAVAAPEAIAAFQALPRSQYQTGWVLSQVGRALAESVRYRESATAFAVAREADPTLLKGLETYSTVLWQLKRGPELSALAQQALALDRLHPSSWCIAGNCFSLQRDHSTALRFFRRATQLDGTMAVAHTLAGHELRAVEAYDAALAAYRSAARADPRHYVAWYGMGAVYTRLERWALAEHHYGRAAALRPASSALLCHLGGALRRLGRDAEALRTLRQAVELDPKNPLARFEAATLLAAAGEHRAALKELQALHDAAPQDASTLFQMGRMHRRLGEPDAALRCFSAALDLQPPAADSDLIKAAIERLRVGGDSMAEVDASDEDM